MFPIRGYCEVTQLFCNMGSLEYKSFKKNSTQFFIIILVSKYFIPFRVFQLTRTSQIIAPGFHSLTRTHNCISIQNQNTLIFLVISLFFTDYQKGNQNSAAQIQHRQNIDVGKHYKFCGFVNQLQTTFVETLDNARMF